MICKDEKLMYIYAQRYRSLVHYSFNIVKKHTAYTHLVQLNKFQIQILKREKWERTPAYTPPYSIAFTIDWPLNPNFENGKMQLLNSSFFAAI